MSRFIGKPYKDLSAYVPGEQPRDMQYIKLNTNENPYPPAPQVLTSVGSNEIALLRLYSDPTCKALKEKLAALEGVKTENVFISNGSDEVLSFLFMAYAKNNGVAFPDITYGFYSVYAALYGAEATVLPLKEDFTIDCDSYCGLNKMVVIANPNAPTGISAPVSALEKIVASNPDNIVVIDEAYVDFGGESCLPLIRKYDNLVVVRTFSKSRSFAGGRLGYAFAAAPVIADLEKLRYATNPYNIDRLTLLLGEKIIDNQDYTIDTCRKIIANRERTYKNLADMGFSVIPSDSNFLFAKYPGIPGKYLYERLKARGILIRHFPAERIKDYIRITIGTDEEMDTFCAVIGQILEETANANS